MAGIEQAIARIRAGREVWIDLVPARPGQAVLVRRPAESEFPAFFRTTGEKTTHLVAGIEDVQKHVVDWRGFAEADAFSDGGSDALAFHQKLWAEIVADNADWSQLIAHELVKQVAEHLRAKVEAAKN